MRALSSLLEWGLVGAVIAGCSSGGGGTLTDASAPQPTTVDGGVGNATCSEGDCTSATKKPSTCQSAGASCNNGRDCCSNRCVDGTCDPCADEGESCGATKCCVNTASKLTCFQNECSTCLGAGAPCKTTSECCSRACTGGTCEAPGLPPPPPPACQNVGSACSNAAPCCSDGGCVMGVCQCVIYDLPNTFAECGLFCCKEATTCESAAGCMGIATCQEQCPTSDSLCRSECVSTRTSSAQAAFAALKQCATNKGCL